jgi:hypothetical protein
MFVIAITSNGTTVYVGKGEYSRFSCVSGLFQAKPFDTKDEALQALTDPEFTKRHEYTDGSSAPPSVIWGALGICNNRKEAEGVIQVLEVQTKLVGELVVKDRLLP